MPKRILDTNVLINHWHRLDAKDRSPDKVVAHARQLAELEGAEFVVSPVVIEFLAGAPKAELDLHNQFLSVFTILDKGDIPRNDWAEAKKFASWGKLGRKRKLGDALLQAIAKRLNAEIISRDRDFPSRVPPKSRS